MVVMCFLLVILLTLWYCYSPISYLIGILMGVVCECWMEDLVDLRLGAVQGRRRKLHS